MAAGSQLYDLVPVVMINLRVDDLDGVLDRFIEGLTVDPKRESYHFGKFSWCIDQSVEFWQPVTAG